jgi:hypothetical protein
MRLRDVVMQAIAVEARDVGIGDDDVAVRRWQVITDTIQRPGFYGDTLGDIGDIGDTGDVGDGEILDHRADSSTRKIKEMTSSAVGLRRRAEDWHLHIPHVPHISPEFAHQVKAAAIFRLHLE